MCVSDEHEHACPPSNAPHMLLVSDKHDICIRDILPPLMDNHLAWANMLSKGIEIVPHSVGALHIFRHQAIVGGLPVDSVLS